MPYSLENKLVIAISSRALFRLESENRIFEKEGLEAYTDFQAAHEEEKLEKGSAFPLIEALLSLNKDFEEPIVEVIIMSRNSPSTGLRVFNSIDAYGLEIGRAGFTGGEPIAQYLKAFQADLFLSKHEEDVQHAIDNGFAAALLYDPSDTYDTDSAEIRIAFDADAVVFSEEAETIFKTSGLEAFLQHEKENAKKPLPEGPFAKLIKTLSLIKQKSPNRLKIAIVTARNSPAHKRVILTLRQWGVHVDQAFFLGGLPKDQVLRTFRPHIFFDDQENNVRLASEQVPSARVPYRSDSEMKKYENEH